MGTGSGSVVGLWWRLRKRHTGGLLLQSRRVGKRGASELKIAVVCAAAGRNDNGYVVMTVMLTAVSIIKRRNIKVRGLIHEWKKTWLA